MGNPRWTLSGSWLRGKPHFPQHSFTQRSAFPILHVVNRHCRKISIKLWKCSTRIVWPFSTTTLKNIVFLLRGLTSLPLESLNDTGYGLLKYSCYCLYVFWMPSLAARLVPSQRKRNCSACVFRFRDSLHKISRDQGSHYTGKTKNFSSFLKWSLSWLLSIIRQDCQSQWKNWT